MEFLPPVLGLWQLQKDNHDTRWPGVFLPCWMNISIRFYRWRGERVGQVEQEGQFATVVSHLSSYTCIFSRMLSTRMRVTEHSPTAEVWRGIHYIKDLNLWPEGQIRLVCFLNCFSRTQPHPSVYILSRTVLCCNYRVRYLHHRLCGPQSLRHLLSCPLQRKVASGWVSEWVNEWMNEWMNPKVRWIYNCGNYFIKELGGIWKFLKIYCGALSLVLSFLALFQSLWPRHKWEVYQIFKWWGGNVDNKCIGRQF